MLGQPATLADPVTYPGAADLLALIAARTWRDVSFGSMLAAGNAVALVLALGLLARATYRFTAATDVTLAITLAASTSSVFVVALAPAPAFAFAATIAAWLAVLRAHDERFRAAPVSIALVFLALLAATAPRLAVPAGIAAGWLSWSSTQARPQLVRRSVRAALAISLVLAVPLIIRLLMPFGPSCVFPQRDTAALLDALRAIETTITANPLATALAVLGLMSIKRLTRAVALSLIPLALASVWGAAATPEEPAWAMGPFVLAFWLLAAAGLLEVFEAAGRTVGGKAGATALAAVLVVLQVLNGDVRRQSRVAADGHERVSLATISTLVTSLPKGAALVEEDATTGLLARALPSRLRAADRFHFVPRDAAIAEELGRTRVFALPRSQRVLQHHGFELVEAGADVVNGLAEIRHAHACSGFIGSAPAPVPEIAGRQQIAVVAGNEQSRGPLILLLPADVALSLRPVDWPPEAIRGFHARTFDMSSSADRQELSDELRTYGLEALPEPPVTRYVTRLETWRTPGAPLVLPIALGNTTGAGTVRLLGAAPDQHLRICPSFPYEVRPVSRRP